MTNKPEAQESPIEVLHPDRELQLGSETVTVREYTWVQAIDLAPVAGPIVEALHDLFLGDRPDDDIGMEAIAQLLEQHRGAMFKMIAVSVDRPVEWVSRLSDEHGLLLLTTWWRVNAGFFTRRLMLMFRAQPVAPRKAPSSRDSSPH